MQSQRIPAVLLFAMLCKHTFAKLDRHASRHSSTAYMLVHTCDSQNTEHKTQNTVTQISKRSRKTDHTDMTPKALNHQHETAVLHTAAAPAANTENDTRSSVAQQA